MARKRSARPTSKQFLDAANSADDLAMVLRAHLVFESVLIHIIAAASRPDLTALDGLNLPERVDVAIALEALALEDQASFRYLNTVRNRFAHDLDRELNEGDAKRFRDALSPSMRRDFESETKRSRNQATPHNVVATCLLSMYVSLEVVLRRLENRLDDARVRASDLEQGGG